MPALLALLCLSALLQDSEAAPLSASPAAATFSACSRPPSALQAWAFSPQAASALQLASNASLCLVPLGCNGTAGTVLVTAGCNSSSKCSLWTYDTFTYFTFTSSPSDLLLTAGAAGAAATAQNDQGTPNQQFMYSTDAQTVSPASDSTLCLTASSS